MILCSVVQISHLYIISLVRLLILCSVVQIRHFFFYIINVARLDWCAFFNISLCCCPPNQAAEVKSSDKHTFGAVNCHINTNLCAKLGVNILPLFKIYSWAEPLAPSGRRPSSTPRPCDSTLTRSKRWSYLIRFCQVPHTRRKINFLQLKYLASKSNFHQCSMDMWTIPTRVTIGVICTDFLQQVGGVCRVHGEHCMWKWNNSGSRAWPSPLVKSASCDGSIQHNHVLTNN